MSEQANGVFRKAALGGFNKKDVLSYLDSISMQYEQEKNELSGNISRLEEINGSLEQELSLCKEEISSLTKRLEDEQEKLSCANESLEDVKKELEQQKNKNEIKNQELIIQMELCDQLKLQIDEYEAKVRGYEAISKKINRTIAQANQSAANIVSEAEKRASSVVSDAQSRADSVNRELSAFRDEISDLRALVKIALYEVEDRLGYIDKVAFKNSKKIEETKAKATVKAVAPPRPIKPCKIVPKSKKKLCDGAFDLLDKLVDKWAK